MFGLLEIEEPVMSRGKVKRAGRVLITPTVQVANDKVRYLFAEKPKPVPDGVDILSAGDECNAFLSGIGLLEPILMAMAQQMADAVKVKVKPYKRVNMKYLVERMKAQSEGRLGTFLFGDGDHA